MFSLFRKTFFSQMKPFTVGPKSDFRLWWSCASISTKGRTSPKSPESYNGGMSFGMSEWSGTTPSWTSWNIGQQSCGLLYLLVKLNTCLETISFIFFKCFWGVELEVFLHPQIVWNKNHDGFHRCPYSVYMVSPINYPSGATPGRDAIQTFLVPQTLFLQRHVQH